MIAFLPPLAFHVAVIAMLEELEAAGQSKVVKYLKGEIQGKSQYSLVKDGNGLYTARWKSSYHEVSAFYSAFLSNAQESEWAVDHLSHSKTKTKIISFVFKALQTQFESWEHAHRHEDIEHQPRGQNRYQPSLIRGSGLWEKKTSLHDKGFYRNTVTSLTESVEKGDEVFWNVDKQVTSCKLGSLSNEHMQISMKERCGCTM